MLLLSVVMCGSPAMSRAEPPDAAAKPAIQDGESPAAPDMDALMQMSLEELVNLQLKGSVESSSKRKEDLFGSPLSTCTISREAIRRSGALSIPEALRLCPGVLVREQTPGNFDVHLRGMQNTLPGSWLYDFGDTTMLVMIDYRVVYNYYVGGTFWDTLPIGIEDVERLEVVIGPLSALYGPNAVSGVINIMTGRHGKSGLHGRASLQYTPMEHQRTVHGVLSFQNPLLTAAISSNYQRFGRFDGDYYAFATGRYMRLEEVPSTFDPENGIPDLDARYPEPGLSLERGGVNGEINFHPRPELDLTLSAGYQQSRSQSIFTEIMMTPLTTSWSETLYADLRGLIWGLTTHLSYLGGQQEVPEGVRYGDSAAARWYLYELGVLDAEVEYEHKRSFWSLRPGMSYRRAEYDGILIAAANDTNDISGSRHALQSVAASVRGECTLLTALRLVAAVRGDYYPDRAEERQYPLIRGEIPTDGSEKPRSREGQSLYLSYQLAATYKWNEDNLWRIVYARANQAPFILNSYMNESKVPLVHKLGNKSFDLLTTDMIEVGYRGRYREKLALDLNAFGSYTRDFNMLYLHLPDLARAKLIFQFDNLPTKMSQLGGTLSLTYGTPGWDAQLFFTLQRTEVWDHPVDIQHMFDFITDPSLRENQTTIADQGAPPVYGGAVLNTRFLQDRLQLNFNLTWFTAHRQKRADASVGMLEDVVYLPAEFEVQPNVLANARISYRFRELCFFANGRNVLNLRNREFPWGDRSRSVYYLGLEASF